MSEQQRPTIGRIVHLIDSGIDGGICHPAIVIEAYREGDDRYDLDLVVFMPPPAMNGGPLTGPTAWYRSVRPARDGGKDGWHWPEREA